jgi:hypothetical protein
MEFFSVNYPASDLLASVATGTQATVADLAPVLAVVAGIILAFIAIRYIVSLVKSTGRSSTRN